MKKALFTQPVSAPSTAARKELKKLGVDTYDETSGKFKDLITIFGELEVATKKMSKESERNATLQKILGVGGIKAYQAAVGQGIEKVREFKAILDTTGTSSSFAKRQLDTYEGSVKILEGSWQTFKVLIGNTLIPVLSKLAGALSYAISGTARFLQQNQGVAKAIGWGASLVASIFVVGGATWALIGAYKVMSVLITRNIILGGLYKSYLGMVSVMKGLLTGRIWANTIATGAQTLATQAGILAKRASITATFTEASATNASGLAKVYYTTKAWLMVAASSALTVAQWALNSALLASPITWIILGVVALGAAIYGIVKYWDSLVAAMKTAWGWMKKIFGMEDSESDKLQSAIDKFDSKLKVLDEKKSKYLQMGFKADSKEIKAIDSEIKTTTGQKEKTSQVLSGVQNYDSKLKELENQKKLIQSAMDSAGKEGKAGEVEALKKRLAETSNSIYALNKNEFIREAQISSIKEGVKEIKNTTDSVKSLNKVVSEVDFTKLNPEQMVSKNNAVMKKMQEQAFYSGKGFVNQMNTGIEHQTAINGGNGALKLAGAMDKPIPHSDAKEGPLSRLTESGRAFVTTFEKGIENALGQSTIMNEFGQKFNPMKPIERDSSINSNIISEGITNNNSNSAKTISLNIGSLIQNAEFRGDKSGMEQIAEILLRLINADVEKYEYA